MIRKKLYSKFIKLTLLLTKKIKLMKRNFLLLLLLTLLPLAGWAAVDVPVGEYTVTVNKQFVALPTEGNAVAPTVSAVKKGATTVIYTDDGVVKKDKQTKVAKINAVGTYYKVVKAAINNDSYAKLLVPFYVGEQVPYDYIDSKETFDNSVKAQNGSLGVLKEYYADCIAEAEAHGTYCGGDKDAWELERDDWSWAASKGFPSYSDGNRFPWITYKAPATGHWNRVHIYGDETEKTDAVFGEGDDDVKYNIISTNQKYATGQINAEGIDSQDNFIKNAFSCIFVPTDAFVEGKLPVPAVETVANLKIMAVTFKVPYGTDMTGNTVLPSMFTILSTGNSQTISEVDLAASGKLSFVKLDTGTDVTIQGHPFKLVYNGEPFIFGGTTYDIVLTTDENTMYFTAEPNTFVENKLPVLVEGLTYNGTAQSLISTETADAPDVTFKFGENEQKPEGYVDVKYLVVPENKVTFGEDTNGNPTWTFAEGYGKDEDWTATPTQTDVLYNKPAGEEGRSIIGNYVFARPEGATNWAQGKPRVLGLVTMQKGQPTLTAITNVKDKYYLRTYPENPNGLNEKIEPSVKVMVGENDLTSKYGEEVYYNVLWSAGNAKLKKFNAADETGEFGNGAGTYTLSAVFAENDNLKKVSTSGRPTKEFAVAVPKVKVTTVVDPASIPFGADPTTGFGFGVKVDTDWEGGSYGEVVVGVAPTQGIGVFPGNFPGNFPGHVVVDEPGGIFHADPAYPTYTVYKDNNGQPGAEASKDRDGNYPAGEYWVLVNKSTLAVKRTAKNAEDATKTDTLTTAGDHVIGDVVAAKLTIGAANILADIEDHTGADALIYGQILPCKLTHVDGLTDEYGAIQTFNNKSDWTFKATLWDVDTDKAILDKDGKKTEETITSESFLPVGTWKVTYADDGYQAMFANNTFNVIAGAGIWTVVPKNLDNDVDAEKAGYSIDYSKYLTTTGYGPFATTSNPKVTYSGMPLLPVEALATIKARTQMLKADEPGRDAIEDDPATDEDETREEIPAKVRDYAITVDNNINAGTGIEITLTGHGNFEGTKTLSFDIAKAEINVYPEDGAMTVGGEENFEIDWESVADQLVTRDYKAWVNEEADEEEDEDPYATLKAQKGFKDLAVKRRVGPNVGTFPEGTVAYLTEGAEEADNYEFNFQRGKLVIGKGTIALKVAPSSAEYNGKTTPVLTKDFIVDEANSSLSSVYLEEDNWKTLITVVKELDWAFSDADADGRWNVGGEYTLSIDKQQAENLTSTNFNIIITPDEGKDYSSAAVEITPAPIKLTAKDQGPYKMNEVEEKFKDAVSPTTVEWDAADLKTGDVIGDLIDEVVLDDEATLKVGTNDDVIGLVTVSENYDYDIELGDLEIINAAALQLKSNMLTKYKTVDGKQVVDGELGDQDKIEQYDGMTTSSVSLTLKAPKLTTSNGENKNFAVWKANDWHAMVLPFAVSPKALSDELGYAVINVVDPAKTTPNDVRFTLINLTQKIPANTPFCFKTAEDFEFDRDLVFENVTIEKPEAWTVAEDAGLGYTFVGTYEEAFKITKAQDYLRFLGPGKWYYVSKEGTEYTMQPYNAYVNLGATSSVREVTFTFEEEDGSTTAIKAIDFLNGNNKANAEGLYRVDGVKINTAPTQKGVYIQGGKKFVK